MLQYLEITGALVGLVYIYLEYKASVWLWLAGIIMPAIYIYVYYAAGFYADMGVNVYYLIAGVYGWAVWLGGGFQRKQRKDDKSGADALPITRMPKKYYLPSTLICLAIFVVIAWILIKFTDSTVPYGDSITTAMSIVAMWMLAHKYVEQWLVWIAVDIICCGLYFYKDLNYTAVLYGLYGIIAIFGYIKWLKMMNNKNGENNSALSTES